jgi:hypothetical protein
MVSGLIGAAIAQPGRAAEQVVLDYGRWQATIALQDLAALAQGQPPSSDLGGLLILANQDPTAVGAVLNRTVRLDSPWLLPVLETPLADPLLDVIGEAIAAPNRDAGRAALRTMIRESTADDHQFSTLELLQRYPGDTVRIRGDRLLNLYRQIERQLDQLQDFPNQLPDWLRSWHKWGTQE